MREPDAAGDGGREGGGEDSVDLFAGGDGERESLEGAEIGGDVAGSARARMFAQVGAGDGFVERLHAIVERGGGGHFLAAAHGQLIVFVGMVVGVHVWSVAVEYEEVAVAAEGETDAGLGAQRLLHTCEPRLGVFPGVEVAVELVGAVS